MVNHAFVNLGFEIEKLTFFFFGFFSLDFDALSFFNGFLDGFRSNELPLGKICGRLEEELCFTWHFDVFDVTVAKAIGFNKRIVGEDDAEIVFHVWNKVLKNLQSFFFVCTRNDNFVKGVGESGVSGG